ncbi:MAG: hypothetical protein ACJ8CR_31190 [Roseiflexaceae bacterium]
MSTEPAVIAESIGAPDRPRMFFFTELDGPALLELLGRPGLLELLAAQRYGIALSVARLDEPRARAARLLSARGVPLVAWLLLPPEKGFAFNLQNYPQAIAHYRMFRAWALEHDLDFEAVGLEIEAPPGEDQHSPQWGLRELARRFWLAGENVLYPSARAAYIEMAGAIRHDGYEVHTYQMPLVVDDRRAGTTVIQRALDIMDLPADVDVLMCSSGVPSERLGYDLGGALIASYGPSADAIGVGSADEDGAGGEQIARLPWTALRRDLLLAARHTDMLYIFSLEDCVERGLLERIAVLDWGAPAHAAIGKRALVGGLRWLLLALLIAGRFGLRTLAWAGWALAAWLWWRGRRAGNKEPRTAPRRVNRELRRTEDRE